MNSTISLDYSTWDLRVDAFGNIATSTAPYALAQDVAQGADPGQLFRPQSW